MLIYIFRYSRDAVAEWGKTRCDVYAKRGCPSDTGYASNGLVQNDRNFTGAAGYAAHAYTPGVSNYIGVTGFGSGRQNAEPNTGIFWGSSGVRFVSSSIHHFHTHGGWTDASNPLNGTYQRLLSRDDGLVVQIDE